MTNIVEKNLFAEGRRETKACSNRLIKCVRSGKISNCITYAATQKNKRKTFRRNPAVSRLLAVDLR